MPDKPSAAAYNAAVIAAANEGRRLTTKERLLNPILHKELDADKARAIKSAEAAVEKAKATLKQAEANLATAKKENQ